MTSSVCDNSLLIQETEMTRNDDRHALILQKVQAWRQGRPQPGLMYQFNLNSVNYIFLEFVSLRFSVNLGQ